jgi:hypothetical protein
LTIKDWFIIAFWCTGGVLWATLRFAGWVAGCLSALAFVMFLCGGCARHSPAEQMQACGIAWQVAAERCDEIAPPEATFLDSDKWSEWYNEAQACKAKAERKYRDCREKIR